MADYIDKINIDGEDYDIQVDASKVTYNDTTVSSALS